jgi:site-specific recombinase XerC
LDIAAETGLRVSELIGVRNSDVELDTGANIRCMGKGRKERCTPLSKNAVAILRAWMKERGGEPGDALLPTRKGTPLSRGAVERLVARHAATATKRSPSLRAKHVTPHVLRHTCVIYGGSLSIRHVRAA